MLLNCFSIDGSTSFAQKKWNPAFSVKLNGRKWKKNEMNKNVHFGFGISVGSKTTENGQ